VQAMPGTSRAGCHGEGLGVWKVWLGAAGRPEGCLEGFVWERRDVRKFSLERRDIRKVGLEWGWERRDVRRDVRKVGQEGREFPGVGLDAWKVLLHERSVCTHVSCEYEYECEDTCELREYECECEYACI